MNKILLVTGKDKHCRKMIYEIEDPRIVFALDDSSNPSRAFRLLKKKRITLKFLIKSAWASLVRPNVKISTDGLTTIRSNMDLINLCEKERFDSIILFKACLIINEKFLTLGIPIFNIHCAQLENYGGLCAIHRAIEDSCYNQEATLHRVTKQIDLGEIISTEKYVLIPNHSYGKNEDIAYDAGIRLLKKVLKEWE